MSRFAPWRWPLRFSVPSLLAVVGGCLTAFAVYDSWREGERMFETMVYNQLTAVGTREAGAMEDRFSRNETELALNAVQRMVNQPYLCRAFFVSTNGDILAATEQHLVGSNATSLPTLLGASRYIAKAAESMSAQYIWAPDRARLLGYFPLATKRRATTLLTQEVGVLIIDLDLAEHKRINLALHLQRAWLMGAVIVFSLTLVWLYVDTVFNRRLTRIGAAIETAAAGESDGVTRIAEADELGLFGKSVERMFAELHARSDALRESEARYRSIIQAMSEGVVIQDSNGLIVASNQSASRILGLTQDQMLGRTSVDDRWRTIRKDGSAFPGEDHPAMVTLRTGEAQSDVLMGVQRPDGEVRWISIHCEPFTLGVRDERGVVSTFTDITERRMAELQGERDRERLSAIVESAMDAVICTDNALKVTLFSRAAERIFGFAEREMLGKRMTELFPPESQDQLVQTFASLSTQGIGNQRLQISEGVRFDKERFPIEASMSIMLAGGAPMVTLIVRDISERKRDEQRREQLEAQLRQSQKLQSLGTLTGGIAHDFNNILTAISGNARLARLELQDFAMPAADAARRSIEEIEKASTRATNLVRQVLAFGRRQEVNRAPVDLSAVVSDALKFLRSMLPAMIEIRAHLPDRLPFVAVDTTQIHQVVTNLGTNAAHAIGDRPGVIEVQLKQVDVDEALAASVADLHAGRYVCLSFEDNGCGIDAEIVERIFEPFFTTKELGQGTGLGLSVVHGIVKSHEGAIAVESTRGKGTTFKLYFPAIAGAVESAPVDQPVNEAQGIGKTIIYVDDEEALVYLVDRLLRRRGYTVRGFTSPDEALQELAKDPAAIDALVSDLAMPGLTGFDVVRRARELRADLPVVLVSGYVRPQDVAHAQRLGVQHVVLKPDTVDALAAALHEALTARADLSETPA